MRVIESGSSTSSGRAHCIVFFSLSALQMGSFIHRATVPRRCFGRQLGHARLGDVTVAEGRSGKDTVRYMSQKQDRKRMRRHGIAEDPIDIETRTGERVWEMERARWKDEGGEMDG
uniref:Uncharacterized protein n=1 Tax=Pristionchus pacificus TaxID=54126 RepID=A0A2A6C6V4_PRIPA|eukprot:PDM73840.1 hypothetical protein PRIPAC_41196 [Pristionchus pacificus]